MSYTVWASLGCIFFCALLLAYSIFNTRNIVAIPHDLIQNWRNSHTQKDIVALFFKTPDEIKAAIESYIQKAHQNINNIIAIPSDQRSFKNTALTLDRIDISDLFIASALCSALEHTSPEEAIRNAAHEAIIQIHNFNIEYISNNKQLYQAFKDYMHNGTDIQNLSDEQKYFLTETMNGWIRAGLDLPDNELEQVKQLHKELTQLTLDFDRNISADTTTVHVDLLGLAGIDQAMINCFKKTDDGAYILGIDYPTYFNIMDNCAVVDTRKRMHTAFNNRAYPANDLLLKEIISKRDMLAKKIGFESYAALDLDNEMVKTPARADLFLADLVTRARAKENEELALWLAQLPESVQLDSNGKIKAWDVRYVQNQYKKKHLAIDEQEISQYFPMEYTIKGLLDIYKQFFSIEFEQIDIAGLWHEDVKLVKVFTKNRAELLGFLLLDLYPRPNKYSHAAHMTLIPAMLNPDGSRFAPEISLVMANFPKSTSEKPSLLTRDDVKTFFHEFGHALHAIMGATQLASFSGTHVKRDFVELPSQMLEEWLWNEQMLKKVSSHYQTGEPLPDDLIEKIVALKQYDSGYWIKRQCLLSLLALNLFGPGANKDPYAIQQTLRTKLSPEIDADADNHFYASFGHLTGYGARYYGYMWSKVFALDVFEEIKKHGLLDPIIGQQYVHQVIGKGGSQDPNILLRNFLHREPNNQAFLKDLGFD